MAPNRRKLREKMGGGRGLTAGWSDWEIALEPLDEDLEHRGNPDQVGLMCSSIKDAFSDEADSCGIYEWKAVGTFRGQRNRVVYVGCTSRRKSGGLRERILEYCRDGSHKEDLINKALRRSYELWVRVKTANNPKDAEDMENDLLKRYDYAWNERNNGEIRNILPKP